MLNLGWCSLTWRYLIVVPWYRNTVVFYFKKHDLNYRLITNHSFLNGTYLIFAHELFVMFTHQSSYRKKLI